MRLLEKILENAKRKGINQTALERAAGLANSRISKWMNGVGEPGWFEVVRMAKAAGIADLNYLADDAITEPPQSNADPELAVVLSIVDKLGTEESIRRLAVIPGTGLVFTKTTRPDQRSEGPHRPPLRSGDRQPE